MAMKLVAEGLRADAGGVADRLLVIVDLGAIGAAARLDLLADPDALDHRPDESPGFDLGPALQELVFTPDLAPVRVMQRADDASPPGLTDIFETGRIVRPKPAPGLQHRVLPARFLPSPRHPVPGRDPGIVEEWETGRGRGLDLPPHRQKLLRPRVAQFVRAEVVKRLERLADRTTS